MKNARQVLVVGAAEVVVVVIAVLDLYTDLDLSSAAGYLRAAVVAAAAVVAVVAYHAWSARSTLHSTAAMVLGLLGGASLASSAVTGTDGRVMGSEPLALVGVVALVASVAVMQVGLAQGSEADR